MRQHVNAVAVPDRLQAAMPFSPSNAAIVPAIDLYLLRESKWQAGSQYVYFPLSSFPVRTNLYNKGVFRTSGINPAVTG